MNKHEINEQVRRLAKSSASVEDITASIHVMLREMPPTDIEQADSALEVICIGIPGGNTTPQLDTMIAAFEPWRDLYGLSERADNFDLAKPN
jgi:hypothetical protein